MLSLPCGEALLLTSLLTHFRQHSPSWDANRFSASQKKKKIPTFIQHVCSLPHSL